MNLDVNSSVFRYSFGFVASLLLTLMTYAAATERWLNSAGALIGLLMLLASVQLIVQVVFFLNILKKNRSPNWRLYSIVFTSAMLIIIVGASLWIMNNLNYNMMQFTPAQKDQYMLENNNKGF